MSFTDLQLQTIDDKPGVFLVIKDVAYTWKDSQGVEQNYVVTAGKQTDLASIPPLFRVFFSKVGRSRKPAVFHDDMYSRQWKTRRACDMLFKRMLIERGMGKFKAWLFYQAVRRFGWTRGRW